MTDDADVIVVCYGGTTRSAIKAVKDARAAGIKAGIFRPISIWPFPAEALVKLAKQAKHIVVVEHNYGQLLLEIERTVKNECEISFIGRVDGEIIMPDQILEKLEEVSNHG